MVRLCENFGSYGTYSAQDLDDGIGGGLPQRFDAAFNFLDAGGRFGPGTDDRDTLAARTNYFRETYAYGDQVFAPGIEPLYRYEPLIDAARQVFGRPIVEPAIVYANLLLPGQELAIHTDVPEFRGLSRQRYPEWLMVVAHHSGLFDEHRMPIATAISWYQDAEAGQFAFFPEGIDAPACEYPVRFNTSLVMDTDSVFHCVDRVAERDEPVPTFSPSMRLHPLENQVWAVRDGHEEVARYRWADMRFSISWKAYCFRDEAEREAWRTGASDLTLDEVVETLCVDLERRGRLGNGRPSNRALARLLVDEYIQFPRRASAAQ